MRMALMAIILGLAAQACGQAGAQDHRYAEREVPRHLTEELLRMVPVGLTDELRMLTLGERQQVILGLFFDPIWLIEELRGMEPRERAATADCRNEVHAEIERYLSRYFENLWMIDDTAKGMLRWQLIGAYERMIDCSRKSPEIEAARRACRWNANTLFERWECNSIR